jgi:release factor H-coupled RctB family protein
MGAFSVPGAPARVRLFASPTSWIEGAALLQLNQLAEREGVVAVAGMPDLHPGMHGPVGCAALAEGVVHPDVVGSDIGCGMTMLRLDLPARKLRLDKAVERLAALEGPWSGDALARLDAEGLGAARAFAAALGTVGGGNHFCELQRVEEVFVDDAGVEEGALALLVHSGSRGFGGDVRARWRRDGAAGLRLEEGGEDYLAEHDLALRYATLNRRIIAERACAALRCEGVEILDLPHNFAAREGARVLHRKGAAPADRGLAPVPGSRGAPTFLVRPLDGPPEALASLAHGAGRKRDRAAMERRARGDADALEALRRTRLGSRVICSDKRLLVEEAPEAYKDVGQVVADLEAAGLAKPVARLAPLVTFKTAREPRPEALTTRGKARGGAA